MKASLKVAIDSRPLEGAFRVEDTFNLLGHAARKVAEGAAKVLGWPREKVYQEAGIPLLLESSLKKALDVDWNQEEQKKKALQTLCGQVDSLVAWVKKHLPVQMLQPVLAEPLKVLKQVRSQDIEPDPGGGGGVRIRQGVAPERRLSVEDGEMRHGRKNKRFTLGTVVEFDAKQCDTCPLRAQCTTAAKGHGRTVSIAEDERLQHRLRKRMKSPAGRERLRERVGVEHRLAHLARRQGPRARYRGVRKNTFELRRAASIQNLESWQRHLERHALKAG